MNRALKEDIEGQYLEAVNSYEKEILGNNFTDVNNYVNLSFLYWAFAAEQIEFNVPNNISDDWSVIGGNKFMTVIDQGLMYYPKNIELLFWKKYFPYRLFMDIFSEVDCKLILKEHEDQSNLVPYFFLHLFDKEAYVSEIADLRKECLNLPTAKNIYILSFIEK